MTPELAALYNKREVIPHEEGRASWRAWLAKLEEARAAGISTSTTRGVTFFACRVLHENFAIEVHCTEHHVTYQASWMERADGLERSVVIQERTRSTESEDHLRSVRMELIERCYVTMTRSSDSS